MKTCIIGGGGKFGHHTVRICLERGYEVNLVCRPKSVSNLDEYKDKINIFPGRTDDRAVVGKALEGCTNVIVVVVCYGRNSMALNTVKAALELSSPESRLVFTCGWHITMDGKDELPSEFKWQIPLAHCLGFVTRLADMNDQVAAFDHVFKSEKKWTVVRGSDLNEDESQGLPVWGHHTHDPILASNMCPRYDFALFVVEALQNDELIHLCPAINGCKTESALAHKG